MWQYIPLMDASIVQTDVTWRPNPTFRGTFNILSTCLSTLFLCLWSAVHVDAPVRKSWTRSALTKIGWFMIGLAAPETLLFVAYRQRSIAAELLEEAYKHLKPPPPPDAWYRQMMKRVFRHDDPHSKVGSPPTRKHPWTMVHGFYASMGGYVLDIGKADSHSFLPDSYTGGRAVLTAEGIQFLMEHDPDLIPDQAEEDIVEKSKANSLAKIILVFQVLWFCTNCLSRRGQSLPITLLEVSTVSHALCTLLAYFCWWKKPLNIDRPTLIRGEHARQACAWMSMSSTNRQYLVGGFLMLWRPAELSSIRIRDPSTVSPEDIIIVHPKATQVTIRPGQVLSGTDFSPVPITMSKNKVWRWLDRTILVIVFGRQPWYRRQRGNSDSIILYHRDIMRWILASAAAKRYYGGVYDSNHLLHSDTLVAPSSALSASLKHRGGDPSYPFDNLRHGPIATPVLTLIYGFPHLSAWNATFPTPLEQWLWRAATIAATASGTLFLALRLMGMAIANYTAKHPAARWAAGVIPLSFLMVITITSSVFLVVESFRQLLYLPPGAYQLPQWSTYWPHFS